MTAAHDRAETLRLEDRLRSSRQLLTRMLRSDSLSGGDIERAYREITELASALLSIERVGVWRLDAEDSRIDCVDLFERSHAKHTSGGSVQAREVPAYFRALADERCIAAQDACADPRTAELAEGYLRPLGIGAMLDAPIWVGGRVVGVVCHEHVGGPRIWRLEEELLAGTVADLVARVIEAADRMRVERRLDVYRGHFQELVSLRRNDLERINAVVERGAAHWRDFGKAPSRDLLDVSPVPLLITGLDDALIRYADVRAAELLGLSVAALVGRSTLDVWADPADRAPFVERLRRDGRIDGHVARLRAANGRELWALISGQTVEYDGVACAMVGFSDITAQKLAELAVRHSEESLRVLFEAAPVSLILSRARDQTVLLANARAADMFDLELDHVVGRKTPGHYVDPRDRDVLIQNLTCDGAVDGAPVEMVTASGRRFWAMMSARVLRFAGEDCFLAGITDISEQKQLEEQLRALSTHDPLTGLLNRRRFGELAQLEFLRSARTGRPLSIGVFDVDHFKQVNDRHGHHVGDAVLIALCRAAAGELRANDVFARHGGEEFVVLFPETGLEGAVAVCERIHAAVAACSVPGADGSALHPTISLGVAMLGSGEDVEAALRRADAALYRAKQAGRNRLERALAP